MRAIFTVGHSTRAIEEFVELLRANGVELLIDIRTVPRSRRNPQFNREALPEPLARAEIGYLHMPELGGLRHPRPDSRNGAWRNDSFRGYADYMQTPEFAAAIEKLIELGSGKQAAIMCAEAVPWRCHRSLVGTRSWHAVLWWKTSSVAGGGSRVRSLRSHLSRVRACGIRA